MSFEIILQRQLVGNQYLQTEIPGFRLSREKEQLCFSTMSSRPVILAISESVRFFLAHTQAREFYVNDLKWTSEQFDEVNWDSLNMAFLLKKKNMYTLWLAKQASSFCSL
jgi:hypothetical protein